MFEGTKRSAFYEVAKFTRVKWLRDSPRFRDNVHFQRLFGDLCLAFLTHTRSERKITLIYPITNYSLVYGCFLLLSVAVHEAVSSSDATQAQVETMKQENLVLQEKVEGLEKGIHYRELVYYCITK